MDITTLMLDFKAEISTSAPTAVQRKGIRTKVGHATAFVEHMSDSAGLNRHAAPTDLSCLLSKENFDAFFSRVLKNNAPTTKEHYIRSIRAFVRYLADCQPRGVSLLDQAGLSTLARRLKQERAALSPVIALHRQALMRRKTEGMLRTSDISAFLQRAKVAIGAGLEELETGPKIHYSSVSSLVGLIVAYFTTVTGIRRGCFLHMTPEDVERAEEAGDEGLCISLGRDKTTHVYGEAQLPVKPDELAWLRRFATLRPRLPGFSDQGTTDGTSAGPETFFFNSKGNPFTAMTVHVKAAYRRTLGRAGVTPTSIRSAIATVSERQLSDREQTNVAKSMGHRRKTRDKHYVGLR